MNNPQDKTYILAEEDVNEFISHFDNIGESTTITEEYGFEAALSIARLVGKLKDPDKNTDSTYGRGLRDKAEEWIKWYKENDADTPSHKEIEKVLNSIDVGNCYTTIPSGESEHDISSMVSAFEGALENHTDATMVNFCGNEQRFLLHISSYSKEEYENCDFPELLHLYATYVLNEI